MMTIRTACAADSAAIAQISCNAMGYSCTEELAAKRLRSLDSSREAVFVAEHSGRAVGFVHAEIYDLLYCERMVNILGLAVDSDYRRQGAGEKLMKAAEDWAREQGAAGVRLNSGGARLGAHEFYASCRL